MVSMPHNGVYSGLVRRHAPPVWRPQHTGQAGAVVGLGAGFAVIFALALALGVAPGALIAHYGFGVKWGKSIAIGVGAMLALGLVERLLSPRTQIITVPATGPAPLPPAVAAVSAASPVPA